jgi:hypothetical protein
VGVFVANSHNRIAGNYIGLDAGGSNDRGNLYQGIYANSASNYIAFNTISGNEANGVWLDGPSATSNTILSNRIGTDASGVHCSWKRHQWCAGYRW